MRIEGVGFVPPAVMGQAAGGAATGGIAGSFSNYLDQALKDLTAMQNNAAALQDAFATGKISDVHQVVIATQEAGIALDLVLSVIHAYEQIMQMQV